jgi:hypothetical protein
MPHILIFNWIRLNLVIHSIFEIGVVKFMVLWHSWMLPILQIVMILMAEIILCLAHCLSHHSSIIVGYMIIVFGVYW